MNSLEKAELTASVRHIERFSKPGILTYNSEAPDTACRKTRRRSRRRRTKTIAKRYEFQDVGYRATKTYTGPKTLVKCTNKPVKINMAF